MSARLLTAITLIGICGFSLARGWSIMDFSIALAKVGTPQQRSELSNTWKSVSIVGSAALRADLAETINISDSKAANQRRETFSLLLSIEPMSSYGWLSVSGLQLITDQPMEQVFDSLELSMLTGPNEGYLIGDRRLFGASLWGRLSPDLKRHVANDVAAEEIPYSDTFRAFVSAQPEQMRNELREALIATGLSPKEIKERLRL